jgi:two-component system response regulator
MSMDPYILLVEDNPEDLALALFAFKKCPLPCGIETARDGEEALNFIFARGPFSGQASKARPRFILLDLKLPKVTGLEVLKELKKDPTNKAIPVVVMTSSSQEKDMVECYQQGANSYIQKPIDFQHFQTIINELCSYWLKINQTVGIPRVPPV